MERILSEFEEVEVHFDPLASSRNNASKWLSADAELEFRGEFRPKKTSGTIQKHTIFQSNMQVVSQLDETGFCALRTLGHPFEVY